VEQLAKLLTGMDKLEHLRGACGTLCGAMTAENITVHDGVLTCPDCAKIALDAVELVTKAEKREWRKL
jgi:hypothetical protein